jgi:hypothetical protein
MKKKPVMQTHHIIYKHEGRGGNRYDVPRQVRKGVHQILTMIQRFSYLSVEEIETIIDEARLKRKFDEKKE